MYNNLILLANGILIPIPDSCTNKKASDNNFC